MTSRTSDKEHALVHIHMHETSLVYTGQSMDGWFARDACNLKSLVICPINSKSVGRTTQVRSFQQMTSVAWILWILSSWKSSSVVAGQDFLLSRLLPSLQSGTLLHAVMPWVLGSTRERLLVRPCGSFGRTPSAAFGSPLTVPFDQRWSDERNSAQNG